LGAPVEGRRFGSGKSSSLTRGRRKRSWFLESVRGRTNSGRLRGATGSVRGRTSASRMVENATPRWHRQRRCPDPPSREARRTVYGRPKLEACRQARAQPGSDCRKAVRRRTEEPDPSARGRRGSILRLARRKLRARKSSGLRVLVSTVGCRGRREASSPRHRGEPRGKPRLHGVARCGDGSRRDALTRIGRKGCEDFRANVTGNAEGFARSQDRDRTDGRHPGLMGGVAFNRVASSGVLATWGATTPDERREPKRRTRESKAEISR